MKELSSGEQSILEKLISLLSSLNPIVFLNQLKEISALRKEVFDGTTSMSDVLNRSTSFDEIWVVLNLKFRTFIHDPQNPADSSKRPVADPPEQELAPLRKLKERKSRLSWDSDTSFSTEQKAEIEAKIDALLDRVQ